MTTREVNPNAERAKNELLRDLHGYAPYRAIAPRYGMTDRQVASFAALAKLKYPRILTGADRRAARAKGKEPSDRALREALAKSLEKVVQL